MSGNKGRWGKHEPFLFPKVISQSGIYVLGHCGLQGSPAMHSFHKNIMHIFLPCVNPSNQLWISSFHAERPSCVLASSCTNPAKYPFSSSFCSQAAKYSQWIFSSLIHICGNSFLYLLSCRPIWRIENLLSSICWQFAGLSLIRIDKNKLKIFSPISWTFDFCTFMLVHVIAIKFSTFHSC